MRTKDGLPGKIEEINQLIQCVSNLLTKTAQCCHPEPPDEIVGYVTRDRGITLHRKDCRAIQRIPENRRDRMLEAQWGSKQGNAIFLAKVRAAKKE